CIDRRGAEHDRAVGCVSHNRAIHDRGPAGRGLDPARSYGKSRLLVMALARAVPLAWGVGIAVLVSIAGVVPLAMVVPVAGVRRRGLVLVVTLAMLSLAR